MSALPLRHANLAHNRSHYLLYNNDGHRDLYCLLPGIKLVRTEPSLQRRKAGPRLCPLLQEKHHMVRPANHPNAHDARRIPVVARRSQRS